MYWRGVGMLAVCAAAVVLTRGPALSPIGEDRLLRMTHGHEAQSPGPELLGIVSLEHRHAVADLIWLEMLQHLGSSNSWNSEEAWYGLIYLSHLASDLDPNYFVVYYAPAVTLSVFANRVDLGNALALRGEAALPQDWRFPFLRGYNALFSERRPDKAYEPLKRAAALPGSPRHLTALAGRVRFASGDRDGAIEFLRGVIPSLAGAARSDAEERLGMLLSESRLERFDRACHEFLLSRGQRPRSIRELMAAGLRERPEDLFGNPISFRAGTCVARTKLIRYRAHELDQRKPEKKVK